MIDGWICPKQGIYVIRDEFDTRTLYVGKADHTSIYKRLSKQFVGRGNDGVANLAESQQTFTVRWAASDNPGLSEGIAITKLNDVCDDAFWP